ncbi:MAG: hypothetical protein FJX76_23430 [Armatimonadetes bacterium]|nr:hypothetical protein [Armatimonadota bacterium]
MSEARKRVVIVGGGPAGLACACALGAAGISFLLVERDAPRNDPPTILHPDGVALLHAWGCDLPSLELQAEEVSGLRVCADLAAVLRARAEQFPEGEVRHHAENVRLQQDEHGVTVDVRRGAAMDVDVVEADFAIACDGTHSLLRRRLKVPLDEVPGEQVWVVADTPDAMPPALEVRLGRDGLPAARHALPDGTRWIVALGDDDDGQALDQSEPLRALLTERGIAAEISTIGRFRYFSMTERLLRRWREGRVLFAGDAAHATSPLWGLSPTLALLDAAAASEAIQSGILEAYEAARRQSVLDVIAPDGANNLTAKLRAKAGV